jgi:hypothetical protein
MSKSSRRRLIPRPLPGPDEEVFLVMTLDEALEYATEPKLDVDFELPEQRGYMVTTKECKVEKVELVPFVKIVVPHIVDPRDFEHGKFQGRVVAGGRAFLLQEPSLPYYLLHNHDDTHMAQMHDSVAELLDIHEVHAERIVKDKARQVKTTLFVFPDGMRCSVDFEESASLTDGSHVTPKVTPLRTKARVLEHEKVLYFLQASWSLRVVLDEDDRKHLKKDAKKKTNPLEEALNGMSM